MPSGLLKGSDMRTLSAALAALTLGLAGTAMAQEAVSPSSSATAGLSRAVRRLADTTAILTELLETIQANLGDPELSQPVLFPEFTDMERQQLERNVDALRARVKAIPDEIEQVG